MLRELRRWWARQLREMLPVRLRRAFSNQDARIVAIDRLDVPDEALTGTLLLRRGGLETAIGALDLKQPGLAHKPGLPTGLRLPPDVMLCREVALPFAAARDLHSVLGFEMDRLTPFSAPELFWGLRGLRQDRAYGRLSFTLFFVQRAPVQRVRQALQRIGLKTSFIEAGDGAIAPARIELEGESWPVIRRARDLLPALCGMLALACVVSPFLRQQLALDAAARGINAARPAAITAMALRRQLAIAACQQAAIAQARRGGDALQVLAALTNALPDGTWLSDLTLKSGDLTFDGRSSNAAALIGLLSAVPGLQNASFTGPVTRAADGTADLFSLHVSVRE